MTQTEIITALQLHANVDPAFTCLIWQKLEEQNPDFFFTYHASIKLRDQVLAFNYLVSQQLVSAFPGSDRGDGNAKVWFCFCGRDCGYGCCTHCSPIVDPLSMLFRSISCKKSQGTQVPPGMPQEKEGKNNAGRRGEEEKIIDASYMQLSSSIAYCKGTV